MLIFTKQLFWLNENNYALSPEFNLGNKHSEFFHNEIHIHESWYNKLDIS